MSSLIGPIKIGKTTFPSNIFYAPLAGCSDFPFRKISSLYGRPGLQFCEMVKMDALVRLDAKTFRFIDYSQDMHPIGAQLCGSTVRFVGPAAKILEDLGFDSIDLNCGCPVDKVTKDKSGSALLKEPWRIGELISTIKSYVKVPVTVKIRAGWDEKSLVATDIVRIAELAGADAVTVHARTREQGYVGPAKWEWIKECVLAARSIKIIGNGDIFSPQDALRMLQETGCHGVLVARGTMGAPWIAEEVRQHAEGKFIRTRTLEERRRVLEEHFEWIMRYQNDHQALIDLRRVGCWYFPKMKGTRQFREAISHAKSLSEAQQLIHTFQFEEEEEIPDIKQSKTIGSSGLECC